MRKPLQKLLALLLAASVALTLCGCEALPFQDKAPSAAPAGEGELTLRFLYVGQADCTLVTLPDGTTLLVDGGNDGDGENILRYIRSLDVERLDLVVATHPHEDHIGGLDKILRELPAGKIYAPALPSSAEPDAKNYRDFVAAAKAQACGLSDLAAGDTVYDAGGVVIDCLAPDARDVYSDLNNYSIVLRITYGGERFLLMGDAEQEVESLLLHEGYALDSTLIKAGHHGSRTSSSPRFIETVRPAYAILSCGAGNSYGFPHEETLATFRAVGAEVYTLSDCGSVFAVSDGANTTLALHPEIDLDGAK